jgi:hypothetical protein
MAQQKADVMLYLHQLSIEYHSRKPRSMWAGKVRDGIFLIISNIRQFRMREPGTPLRHARWWPVSPYGKDCLIFSTCHATAGVCDDICEPYEQKIGNIQAKKSTITIRLTFKIKFANFFINILI